MLIINHLSMARYSSTCVSRAILDSVKLLSFKELSFFAGKRMLEFNLHAVLCTQLNFSIIAFFLAIKSRLESPDQQEQAMACSLQL